MAEKRKLLAETEKCFKKIEEGIEEFEMITAKMADAASDHQRDRYQDELKKEIKKLQRLRDALKTWQSCSEIKDKEKLIQYRKIIEQRMEQFKDIERENKTKPHSKVGLSAEDKVDPRQKEKHDTTEWLQTAISSLGFEIDRTESALEKEEELAGKKQRRGRDDTTKVEQLKNHRERMRFHICRLELCMRLVSNDLIESRDVIDLLKEQLELFLESLSPNYDGENGPSESLDPESIYEQLNLDSFISALGTIGQIAVEAEPEKTEFEVDSAFSSEDVTPYRRSSLDHASSKKNGSRRSTKSSTPAHMSSPSVSRGTMSPAPAPLMSITLPSTPFLPFSSIVAKIPTTAVVDEDCENVAPVNSVECLPASPRAHTPASIATEAGQFAEEVVPVSALSPASAASTLEKAPTPVEDASQIIQLDDVSSFPTLALSNNSLNTPVKQAPITVVVDALSKSEAEDTSSQESSLKAEASKAQEDVTVCQLEEENPEIVDHNIATSMNNILNIPPLPPLNNAANIRYVKPEPISDGAKPVKPSHHREGKTYISPWLGAAPLGFVKYSQDVQDRKKCLEDSANHVDMLSDRRLNGHRFFVPTTDLDISPHWPRKIIAHHSNPQFYDQLSAETLFFQFYYFEGTLAQLYAAAALKRQFWRFHTKYLMWFQRHEDPISISDTYEEGSYLYFDYEEWKILRKDNFIFEYCYLEDNDLRVS